VSSSIGINRLRLLTLIIVASLSLGTSIAAEGAFHLTIGTTGDPRGRNTDSVTFVVETESGDIVIAGNGGSRWSDDGVGNHTSPLIARINANGDLQWQRVYDDLESHRITALISDGEEQYIVLEQSLRGNLVSVVTLKRIDEQGNPSDVIGTLEGFWVVQTIPVVDGDLSYFLLAAKKGATSREAYASAVQLFRLDLQGRITEMDFAGSFDFVEHLQHVGGQEFLLSRSGRGREVVVDGRQTLEVDTDILRLDRSGEIDLLFTLVNRMCRHVAVSQDQVLCTEYVAFTRQPPFGAIVAYTPSGEELWRRDFEPNVEIRQMHALASGDVLVAYQQGENTIVSRHNSVGDAVVSHTMHSTGEYVFLTAIETLRDGRIAFLGSTGSFGAFASTDTDAMLLVADSSGNDLTALQIVSTIVDYSAGASIH
jgi:hypothetical protein